jgi:hypothetical protein
MKQSHITVAAAVFAASLSLSACNTEPEVVTKGPADPQADELAKAAPVQLPPAIASSRTYRCRDNSLVYINFMTDGVTATVRDAQEEPPVATLTAPAAGQPFVAEGFSLSGNGERVTYKSPDAPSQSCRA